MRPRFWRMLSDILRFNRQVKAEAAFSHGNAPASEMTVGDFLDLGRYSHEFARYYLLPMGSAIWSCPIGVFEEFPMRFVVEFFGNHGLLELRNRPAWRVIEGGGTYVRAMVERFRGKVWTGTPVMRVTRSPEGVLVLAQGQEARTFDHVIFACHSDQWLSILGDPRPVELELLRAFPYQKNIAVLHTDTSTLPRRRAAWASWNYHLRARVLLRRRSRIA